MRRRYVSKIGGVPSHSINHCLLGVCGKVRRIVYELLYLCIGNPSVAQLSNVGCNSAWSDLPRREIAKVLREAL